MVENCTGWPDRVAMPARPAYDLIADPTLPGRPANWYVQWHITDRCNLRCSHCYNADKHGVELPLSRKVTALERLVKFAARHRRVTEIAFTGGEPLTSPDLWPLLDRCVEWFERGYPVDLHLMTNGVALDDRLLDRLRSYRPLLRSFQVSVDGATAATNDAIRGRGVYERALAALRLLAREGYQTALHFVLHRQNAAEALAVLDLAQEVEANRVTISRLVPIGRGEAHLMLPPLELRDLMVQLDARARGLAASGRRRRTLLARGRCDLWHLVDEARARATLAAGAPPMERYGSRCPVGGPGLTLLPDGTVFPCRRLEIPLGNVLEQPLVAIWYSSDLLWQLRYRERFQEGKCRECEYLQDPALRPLCGGGAPCISYGVTGSCFTPDPQCWHQPHQAKTE